MKDNTLKLYLEEDFGFKLILHKRDFTPGVTIQGNIVDAITKSRRMFVILSRQNVLNFGFKKTASVRMQSVIVFLTTQHQF